MRRIAKETVDAVKNHNDIVDIIQPYVSLKRRGRNFIGLCPFHSEKTPSFTVSPDKRIFHCFGCHESGDHISFVMKIDNLSFSEAIRQLATRLGIELIEEDMTEEDRRRQNLRDALQPVLFASREVFESALIPGSLARQYLEKRGVTNDAMRDFHLGYADAAFKLESVLEEQGYSTDLLLKSGIFFKTPNGHLKNRFVNRVMFPVIDHHGRTVGFGGRILENKGDAPKYVNSEDTILFNKRRLLYGLDRARNDIRKKDQVLVMEGYMDVIMAHQYGFTNAVATMGTALTPDHIKLIKRFTTNVVLAMDSDEAGQRAMERSFELLRQQECKVQIMIMSEKDPADVLVQEGADVFQALIDASVSMMDFKLDRMLKDKSFAIEDVPDILASLIPILSAEKDAIIIRHYIKKIANRLQIDEELVMAKYQKSRYNVRERLVTSSRDKKDKYKKAEEGLIYILASNLGLRSRILDKIQADSFITKTYQALVSAIESSSRTDRGLVDSLEDDAMRTELSRILVNGEAHGLSSEAGWEEYVDVILSFDRGKRIEELKVQIKHLEESGDEEGVTELLQELQSLIKLA